MDATEAKRRRCHAAFNAWLENESEFDRRTRQERYDAEQAQTEALLREALADVDLLPDAAA